MPPITRQCATSALSDRIDEQCRHGYRRTRRPWLRGCWFPPPVDATDERAVPDSPASRAIAEHEISGLGCIGMEPVVLRVRLISGDSMDVTYEDRDARNADEVIDHVVSTLAQESGVLRCSHGDRLLVLYARGVAAMEVAPRGAVL